MAVADSRFHPQKQKREMLTQLSKLEPPNAWKSCTFLNCSAKGMCVMWIIVVLSNASVV